MKISTILEKKGGKVVTVRPTTNISTVAHRLRLERVGCAVVSSDQKRIEGIVAVRDIVYALASHETEIRKVSGAEMLDAKVSEVMTPDVRTCSPNDNLRDVMMTMNRLHILHVPVVEKGELCGIVSIDDVVKYAVMEMDMERDALRDAAIRLQTTKDLGH